MGARLSRFLGDGRPPTFSDGILIMEPYKPLRTWVDEFIPYCMEIMGVDRPWHIYFILVNHGTSRIVGSYTNFRSHTVHGSFEIRRSPVEGQVVYPSIHDGFYTSQVQDFSHQQHH